MRDTYMKRLFMGGMLVAVQCQAVTYEWPYVSSVDVTILDSERANYDVHMATAVIVNDAIQDGTTVGEVMTAHGIASYYNMWEWGFYHRHKASAWDLVARTTKEDEGKMTATWVKKAKNLTERFGSGTFRITHNGMENGEECIGSGMWGQGSPTDWGSWPSLVWNGGVTGACLGTPPVNQWCAMKTPTVEIAYGTLTLKDAEGSNKAARVTVECTTGMKYTLRLRDANNETTLDNGGRVTWQAGGKAIGETLTGEAGENGVDLTATLHGPFERTGEFKGSGILFVSYP
ncbi:hypothetical protein [Pantoea ananatis]